MSLRAARVTSASSPTSDALTRLFETVHEGIYLGTLRDRVDATVAANPHIKLMFGHPPDAEASAVRPFEP